MLVSKDFLKIRAILNFKEKPMKSLSLQLVLVLTFALTAGASDVTYVLETPGVV